ncbi:hypothetical protein BGW42_004569 [Actinomortierella wolfii]|nr:hypothetical protein BGW42_004569 [Actinomortierella wolfii]
MQLPVECLELIVEHLEDDSATLYNLLTANRLFFLIAVKVLYKSPFRLIATIPPTCASYQDLVFRSAQLEAASSHKEKATEPSIASPTRHDFVQSPSSSSSTKGCTSTEGFAYSIASSALPSNAKIGETTVWGEYVYSSCQPVESRSSSVTDTPWPTPMRGSELKPKSAASAWPTVEEREVDSYAAPGADEPLSNEARMQHHALRQQLKQDWSNWSRFLRRTELLGRLLLLSVDIPGIQERAPRLHERFVPNKTFHKSSEAPSVLSPPYDQKSASASDDLLTSLLDDSVRPTVSILNALTTDVPDLISFADFETEDNEDADFQHGSEDTPQHTPYKPTIDYFRYYIHLDHRGLWSVLTLLFPGAGRRVYDRIQAEIELGILKYCAPRIEYMQITNPRLVIPYMLENCAQFTKLREIDLLDKSWKTDELELVYSFLAAHARQFPAATKFAPTVSYNGGLFEDQQPCSLSQASAVTMATRSCPSISSAVRSHNASHAPSAIRCVRYRSSRSPWDNMKLHNRLFDPLQLLLALGPGISDIDMLHWPRTRLSDLIQGKVDAGAIRRLVFRYLDEPNEPSPWHAPEFLQQCRQLMQLRIYTFEAKMFSWAVQEQRARAQYTMTSSSARTPTLALPSPVPLQYLELTAPSDDVLHEVVVSALYAFQKTLQVLDSRSYLERRSYLSFDPSQDDDNPIPHQLFGHSLPNLQAKQRSRCPPTQREEKECVNGGMWMGDDGFREWMFDAPITVRWPMERLRELRLTGGGLALEFDLDSLRWMPNLHTLVLGIQESSLQNERFRWVRRQRPFVPKSSSRKFSTEYDDTLFSQKAARRQSLLYLPHAAGPQLRRVMFRGPWPEISDCTLARMVNTTVDNHSVVPEWSLGSSSQEHPPSRVRWGDRLLELSVLDNHEVTVQGMTHLAASLEHVQIVGFNTNICKRTSTRSWKRYQRLKRLIRKIKQRHLWSLGRGPLPVALGGDDEVGSEQDLDWMWESSENIKIEQIMLELHGDEDMSGRKENDEEEMEEEDALKETRPLSPEADVFEFPTGEHGSFTQYRQWVEQQLQGKKAFIEDPNHVVEDWLLRAQVALPWIDLGPDAQHLGRRTGTVQHSEHGWMS